jgi:biopolymer transport protein ExbD
MISDTDFFTPRSKKSLFINLTSLIDVLFLLLIFFAVTSTFEKQAALKVALPQAKGGAIPDTPSLEITVAKNQVVFLNGSRVSLDTLKEKVQTAIASSKPTLPALHFKVDKSVPYGFAIQVMSELKDSGIQSLMAITETTAIPTDTATSRNTPPA